MSLRAPFPYYGNKHDVGALFWRTVGDPRTYIEPFAGGLGVLLTRPGGAGERELVNDLDGLVVNAWRGIKHDPGAVLEALRCPPSELDLLARQLRLVAARDQLAARLGADPVYYDARLAGWWVWGASQWIGSSWCGSGPWFDVDGQARKLPQASRGRGVSRQLPQASRGQGVSRKLPQASRGQGVRDEWIARWLDRLAERLRDVVIACGDWRRLLTPAVVDDPAPVIFLDPPYDTAKSDGAVYAGAANDTTVHAAVREWALAAPAGYRVVVAGYDGDWPDIPAGWTVTRWTKRGTIGGSCKQEVLYLSPSLGGVDTLPLFTAANDNERPDQRAPND